MKKFLQISYHYPSNKSNANNFEIKLILLLNIIYHAPLRTICKGSHISFNFTSGRSKASGIILFFYATNSQGINHTHAVNDVKTRKICYGKADRKKVPHTNSLRKVRILSEMQRAIHWQINHKRMWYVGNMILVNKSSYFV